MLRTSSPKPACAYCTAHRGTENHRHKKGCPHLQRGDDAKRAAAAQWLAGVNDAMKTPAKRGPHSNTPSYRLGWQSTDARFGPGDEPRIAANTPFSAEYPGDTSIEIVRREAREFYGRDVYVDMKVGPWRGNTLPITPVDNTRLETNGTLSTWPQNEGAYVLIGHFI